MDQSKWQKIEELFNAALELPTEKRAAFLDSACQDDELKSEVEALLENDEKQDSFLDKANLSLALSLLNEKKYLLSGKKIGRYQIISLLGEGGMGEVYLAEDLQLNRQVALKLLTAHLTEDNESVARFQKEALAASSISHPHIAHIYEAGIDENHRFIAMEFVEGTTLRDLIKQKKLDVIKALDIIEQTANALASAHRAGVIHRDIKPENIMISSDGYVKILDFGIAKLSEVSFSDSRINFISNDKNLFRANQNLQTTKTELIMGTMSYISPEQLSGKNVSLQTDIWSLGVVLYEILSGNKPFGGKTQKEIGNAILHDKPYRFSVPVIGFAHEETLRKILARTLNKKATDRYQSAWELARDLKELKQKLEFSRQFSTGEINYETSFYNSGAITQPQSSSFITKSKLAWNQQSFSRKALLLALCIGFLTFAAGVSLQYFSHFYSDKDSQIESFSPDSRDKWQVSTLFSIRKKLQGSIPSVSFSPDGKSIAFAMSAENAMDIYVKQLNQAEPTKLIEGKSIYQTPVWSPDGQQIAFVSNRDNKSSIWTIPAQGGTPVLKTNLPFTNSLCELLKWSNDGNRLFFKSARSLKTIELDSGQIKEINFPLTNVGWDFNISADESLIALMSLEAEKKNLWIYNLQTGELKEVTNQATSDFSPAIFSDNKRLIFSSNQTGNSQIYIADVDGGKPTQITFSNSNIISPIVSADRRRIVYISENNVANIFMLNVNTKKEMRLTEETRMQLFPGLSKDLSKLVFQTTNDDSDLLNSPLKVKNLQTNSESYLENQVGFWAKWSPATDEIAYIRNTGADYNIWKTDFAGNQIKQLTSGGIWIEGTLGAPFNLMSPPFDWSADGEKITFVSNQSKISNVWMTDSDGANSQKLTDNDNPKLKYSSPLWSPDGSKIAFNQKLQIEPKKSQYGIALFSNNQTREIFQDARKIRLLGWEANGNLLASVDDSDEVKLFELSELAAPKLLTKITKADFHSLILSPDGKAVVYSARRNGIDNIFSYSITGKEKQLTDNRDDLILFSGISWSPAADSIFYSKQSGGIQISLISDNSESTK